MNKEQIAKIDHLVNNHGEQLNNNCRLLYNGEEYIPVLAYGEWTVAIKDVDYFTKPIVIHDDEQVFIPFPE